MSLDAQEFAEAIRLGIARSGLSNNARAAEINYLPLAMAIVEYLKSHLQVTLPAGTLNVGGDGSSGNDSVNCEVS